MLTGERRGRARSVRTRTMENRRHAANRQGGLEVDSKPAPFMNQTRKVRHPTNAAKGLPPAGEARPYVSKE